MYGTFSRLMTTRGTCFCLIRSSRTLRTSGELYRVISPVMSTIVTVSIWRVEMFTACTYPVACPNGCTLLCQRSASDAMLFGGAIDGREPYGMLAPMIDRHVAAQ